MFNSKNLEVVGVVCCVLTIIYLCYSRYIWYYANQSLPMCIQICEYFQTSDAMGI